MRVEITPWKSTSREDWPDCSASPSVTRPDTMSAVWGTALAGVRLETANEAGSDEAFPPEAAAPCRDGRLVHPRRTGDGSSAQCSRSPRRASVAETRHLRWPAHSRSIPKPVHGRPAATVIRPAWRPARCSGRGLPGGRRRDARAPRGAAATVRLERGSEPVETIAADVGFTNAEHMVTDSSTSTASPPRTMRHVFREQRWMNDLP